MKNDPNRALGSQTPEGSLNTKGQNHLFAVGINTYEQVGKLANARGDAEAFVQLLKDRYQFDDERITEIYDEDATRKQIMKRLRNKLGTLETDDNLLVFFSGHGHYDEVIDEGYWVPVDAELDASDTYISYDYLMKVAKAAKKARHVLFIVDSCYSGAVLVKGKNTNHERLERDPSRWIIASGRNEVVPDGIEGENSPFAEELLSVLEKNAGEGIHTLRLIDRLTENVSWNSKQTPIGQPLHGLGHKGGQFVFHPKVNEERVWKEAKALDSEEAYVQYLKNWPQATYSDIAAWSLATKRDTKEAYRSYIEKNTEGTYRTEAIDRLGKIEDKERFDEAKLMGEGALIHFCDTYTSSAFIEAAREEIDRIRSKDREPQTWQDAKSKRSLDALEMFLKIYPESRHKAEAKDLVEILKQEKAQREEQERQEKEEAERKARQEQRRREAAEAKRKEEEKRLTEAAEAKREEEKRLKEEAAEAKRIEENKKKVIPGQKARKPQKPQDSDSDSDPQQKRIKRRTLSILSAIVFLIAISVGSIFYFSTNQNPISETNSTSLNLTPIETPDAIEEAKVKEGEDAIRKLDSIMGRNALDEQDIDIALTKLREYVTTHSTGVFVPEANERIEILNLQIGEPYQEGIVFGINHSQRSISIAYAEDLGRLNWEETQNALGELGEHWRLPEYAELVEMNMRIGPKSSDNKGKFVNKKYWSSSLAKRQVRQVYNFQNNGKYEHSEQNNQNNFLSRPMQVIKY